MNIVVYGAGKNGLLIKNRIEKFYNKEYTIKTYIDANKEGMIDNIPIIKPEQFVGNEPVVISLANRKAALGIFRTLKKRNIENIYLYLKLDNPCYEGTDFLENECIKIVGNPNEMIHHIEMHAVDFCNLNCKACIHYAPLFKREEFDGTIIYDDLKKLSGFTTGVLSLYIMGGEPLLRDDLPNVIIEARKVFPYSDIQVLTNGLLVPKYSEALWSVMRENKVTLTISEYMPTQKLRKDIEQVLQANKVLYIIRAFNEKDKFIKTLCLDSNSKYERTCICDGCINIYKGKVSRCPAVMYLDKLNEAFAINLPNQGIYELSDFRNVNDLNSRMEEKIPLCEHCVYFEIEWNNCGKNLKLEDFVIVGDNE